MKVTKKLMFSSEDDTEEEEEDSLYPVNEIRPIKNDEDELMNIINQEIMDAQELIDFEGNSFEVGEFVLISFSKKEEPNEHYVGKIVSR